MTPQGARWEGKKRLQRILLLDALLFSMERSSRLMRPAAPKLLQAIGLALLLCGIRSSPAGSQAPPPSPARVYATVVAPSLALVVTEGGNKVGTAFCIFAKGSTAYFLTNQHVISDERGKVEPFTLVFPGQPSQEIPGRLVKSGSAAEAGAAAKGGAPLPDLALIAADVPFPVKALSINTHEPSERWASDIAGFPTRQTQDWRDSQKRVLRGANVPGSIGSFTGLFGDTNFYIYYNATTDAGDSGGPLYDPRSGSIYGVIKGIAGGDFASVQQGVAIPAATVQKFLADVPTVSVAVYTPSQESVDAEELQGTPRAPKHLAGSPACLNALTHVSKDFGDWFELRSALVAELSGADAQRSGLASRMRQGQAEVVAYDDALKSDVRLVSASSSQNALHLSESLLRDVESLDAADAAAIDKLAAGAKPSAVRGALQTSPAGASLKATLHRFNSLQTCSPGA